MFRYILILVLLVASASPAMAVDTLQVRASDPILEDWRWTVFDKNDGLAGRVFDVYEDGDISEFVGLTLNKYPSTL